MAGSITLTLNPSARQMARSMLKLMDHIAKRDLKLSNSGKQNGLLIFPHPAPPAPDPLGDALTTLQTRLEAVLAGVTVSA